MNSHRLAQTSAFVLAGILGIGSIFFGPVKFIANSHAQEPPATTETAPAETTPAVVTPPEPEIAEASELEGFLEPFIYDIVNRRDPFQPYADYVPSEVPGGNSRPLTPAQRFDLDKLRLIGIMWDVKDPKAMFMDPESEVLTVGRDDGIGNQNGYVAAIREGEVVVVEAIRKRGDVVYKTRVLRLER